MVFLEGILQGKNQMSLKHRIKDNKRMLETNLLEFIQIIKLQSSRKIKFHRNQTEMTYVIWIRKIVLKRDR